MMVGRHLMHIIGSIRSNAFIKRMWLKRAGLSPYQRNYWLCMVSSSSWIDFVYPFISRLVIRLLDGTTISQHNAMLFKGSLPTSTLLLFLFSSAVSEIVALDPKHSTCVMNPRI